MQHILIVEDDPHIANGIQFNLESEGYFVTTVAEGPQALAVFGQHPGAIDLIVLDLMLPGMSGYAVCEEVRRHDVDIPILILSAPRSRKTASAASTWAPMSICKSRSTWRSC